MNLNYLNKKNDTGSPLSYNGFELAEKISLNSMKIIRKNKAFKSLSKYLPKEYIDLYFKKMIYESSLEISNQYEIISYDKSKNGFSDTNFILCDSFPCIELLNKAWPCEKIDFKESMFYKTKLNLKKLIKRAINTFRINKVKKKSDGKGYKIAVNYLEGFDIEKRSDIFWFENSQINPNSVLVYYESDFNLRRFDKTITAFDFFNKKGFEQVKQWNWKNNYKTNLFAEFYNDTNWTNPRDKIDKWILKSIKEMCSKIEYWISFFKFYNIKVHIDSKEFGCETIIKQIAINKIGGVSVGKLRSYPMSIGGEFKGYYPNDIFFTWGENSAQRIEQLNPTIKNIICSGFPYKIKQNDENLNFLNKTKFNILLLDTNHSYNRGLTQFLYTPTMITFFEAFIELIKNDKDIGLIIKNKKPQTNKFINEKLDDLIKSTGRCHIISDPFQTMASSYLNEVSLVVAISIYLPSVILECAANGARSIFYDTSNMQKYESDIFKWGKDKVIFNDLKKMIRDIKIFKNQPTIKSDLGIWSDDNFKLNTFNDNIGSKRIGEYLKFLIDGFNDNKDANEIVKKANSHYAENWGAHSIYKITDIKYK